MIQARDIHKHFGALEVLRGIDLSVRPHAITSIVGPSGAGKTTLLQILGTLSRPDAGSVSYDTTDVFAMPDKALSRFRNRNIGFVFQAHRLLPEFTLQENVAMPALIGGTPRHEAFAAAWTSWVSPAAPRTARHSSRAASVSAEPWRAP